MKVRAQTQILVGALALLLSGCEIAVMLPSSAGFSASVPIGTIIAATAAAAQSQTAALIPPTITPTWTPRPTNTPSLTPTLTPTFLFLLGGVHTAVTYSTPLPVATSTQSGGSSSETLDGCTQLSQTPADGRHYAARASFTVAWKVKNTGSSRWDSDNVVFAYYSGTRMYTKQTYHLPVDIPRGEYVTMNVPMTAPKNTGTYRTVWAMRRGDIAYPNPDDDIFCHVDLTIHVP